MEVNCEWCGKPLPIVTTRYGRNRRYHIGVCTMAAHNENAKMSAVRKYHRKRHTSYRSLHKYEPMKALGMDYVMSKLEKQK